MVWSSRIVKSIPGVYKETRHNAERRVTQRSGKAQRVPAAIRTACNYCNVTEMVDECSSAPDVPVTLTT